jgi:hypothetical protein
MSKKDKSKFKRIIRSQMMQGLAKQQNVGTVKQTSVTANVLETDITAPANTNLANQATLNSGEINLPQIKYDLKKTAITVLILSAIIGLLYYLNTKNGILLTFGDWLFKVLHIN